MNCICEVDEGNKRFKRVCALHQEYLDRDRAPEILTLQTQVGVLKDAVRRAESALRTALSMTAET